MSYPARAEGLVNKEMRYRNEFIITERRKQNLNVTRRRGVLPLSLTLSLSLSLSLSKNGNCTRILRAISNKFCKKHPTKQLLYGLLPIISKTIQIRRTRHARHCCKGKDELISDILLWTPSHGRTSIGRPARTYLQQFCSDSGRSLEDLLAEAMDDRDG